MLNNFIPSPEYVTEGIAAVFEEGATCLTVGCFNAAGTMFRLCIDLSTRSMLPKGDTKNPDGRDPARVFPSRRVSKEITKEEVGREKT